MVDGLGIPESVRNKIKKMVDEATNGINAPEIVKMMIVQISYEMYKIGWLDAYKMYSLSLEMQKNLFEGRSE